MKRKVKVLIICILITLSCIPVAYAYWTDTLHSKVKMSVIYDVNLKVTDDTKSSPIDEEVLPQAEGEVVLPPEDEDGKNVDTNNSDMESEGKQDSPVEGEYESKE